MFERCDDPVSGGESLSFMKRMGLAVVGIALFLGWKHLNSPSNALAGWDDRWQNAVVQSRSTGKPIVALFTADWCPACRHFEAETLAREDVKQFLRARCTPVVIDLSDRGEESCRMAERARVQSIPTVVLYDREGREVDRAHGLPADAFMEWIERGISK